MHLLVLFYHLSLFFFPFFFLGNLYKVVTTMVTRAVKENFNCKHRALIFLWLLPQMFGRLPFLISSKKWANIPTLRTDRVFYFFIYCKNQWAMAGCFLLAFTNRSSTTFLLLPNNGVIADWLLSPDILPLNSLSVPLFVINTIACSSFCCCNCTSINAIVNWNQFLLLNTSLPKKN